jgi:hypothetical protein
MERGALARAQKGAIKDGRTILFVDQSGFLPFAHGSAHLRSGGPISHTP